MLEEWRLGRGAFARINDKQWPVIFQGSRYAERLPIGKPEIIKTAARDTLYRFYKDWYRPDQMAVIAVGDFDPAAMEKEVQARFGDLANPAKERQRTVVPVPHDHAPLVVVALQRHHACAARGALVVEPVQHGVPHAALEPCSKSAP